MTLQGLLDGQRAAGMAAVLACAGLVVGLPGWLCWVIYWISGLSLLWAAELGGEADDANEEE